MIAAGARPCSGAILVLVFALAQGLFAAGVAATFAMALGTAVATGALAWIAVFAKSTAMRLAAGENSRLALVAKGSNSSPRSQCWFLGLRYCSARAARPEKAGRRRRKPTKKPPRRAAFHFVRSLRSDGDRGSFRALR